MHTLRTCTSVHTVHTCTYVHTMYIHRAGNNCQMSDIFMCLSDQRTIWSAIMSEQLFAHYICPFELTYMYIHVHDTYYTISCLNFRSKSSNGRTRFNMFRQIHWTYLSYYFQLCIHNDTYMYIHTYIQQCTYICTCTCNFIYILATHARACTHCKKLATLEAKELNERQRADLATSRNHQLQTSIKQLETRYLRVIKVKLILI